LEIEKLVNNLRLNGLDKAVCSLESGLKMLATLKPRSIIVLEASMQVANLGLSDPVEVIVQVIW